MYFTLESTCRILENVTVAKDLRYALRMLFRTPAFTLPAVASLALGIALNKTIFSDVSAELLRPLGDPDLVRIGRMTRREIGFRSSTYREYLYLREHAMSLSGLAGHADGDRGDPGTGRIGIADRVRRCQLPGGLYGLASYSMERHLKEIGIRVAMGATRAGVFRSMVASALRISTVGIVIGAGIATGVTCLPSSVLFGVSPTDPLTQHGWRW